VNGWQKDLPKAQSYHFKSRMELLCDFCMVRRDGEQVTEKYSSTAYVQVGKCSKENINNCNII
jgi:hypothetical protein